MTGIEIQGSVVAAGDRVVYPNGGICKVKGVERTTIAGHDLVFLVLKREEDEALIRVPQGKVASIGLRKVATGEAIRLLFEYFTSSSSDPELDWKVRHRENGELMAAGGLLDTAKVLKGLHALAQIRPLPTKEREMYDNARHQLVREISASLNLPPAVAENNLDYALTPPPGSGRTAPKDVPIDIKVLRRTLGGGRKAGGGGGDDDMDLGEEGEDGLLGLDEEAGEEGGEAAGEEGGEAAETPAKDDGDEDEAPKAKAGKAAKEPKAAKAPKEPKAAKEPKEPKAAKAPKEPKAAPPVVTKIEPAAKPAEKVISKPAKEPKVAKEAPKKAAAPAKAAKPATKGAKK